MTVVPTWFEISTPNSGKWFGSIISLADCLRFLFLSVSSMRTKPEFLSTEYSHVLIGVCMIATRSSSSAVTGL